MWKIDEILTDLTIRTLRVQDGAKQARAWRQELGSRRSLLFTWETELLNPLRIPDWANIYHENTNWKIPWNTERWRKFRQSDWIRRCKEPLWDDGVGYIYTQSLPPHLLVPPSEKATLSQFNCILATIPPEVFEWCEITKKLIPNITAEGSIQILHEHGLLIQPSVLAFIIVEKRARYWRTRKSHLDLPEVEVNIPDINTLISQNRPTQQYHAPCYKKDLDEILAEYHDILDSVIDEASEGGERVNKITIDK